MTTLIDINDSISTYVNSLKFALKPSSKVINIDVFKSRAAEINKINNAIDSLILAIENLKELQSKMIEAHETELSAITGLISDETKLAIQSSQSQPSKKKQGNNGWSVVQKGGKATKQAEKAAQVIEKPIRYIEGLKIEAASPSGPMQSGVLYYDEAKDYYMIKFAGLTLTGNIGMIYNHEKNPDLIKLCKWGTSDNCQHPGRCGYYHNDVKKRNFMAPMWMYNSYTNNVNNGYRGFGSRDKLAVDIGYVREEDIDRHSAMLMHDLLCLCLMKQNARSN